MLFAGLDNLCNLCSAPGFKKKKSGPPTASRTTINSEGDLCDHRIPICSLLLHQPERY